MSGHSPSRLRAKTEFTDFFRGASSNQRRPGQLEVPSSDTEASTKKKVTRIQLFGRSRKKSNQSTASSPFVSSRESLEFGSRPASSDRRPSVISEPQPLPPLPPLPTKVHSNTIGSKLAATFGHSRLPKPTINIPTESARSTALSPSTSRSASYDSGSSNGTRSTTPRPAQPLITVSLSPDNNLSEYRNLFTRPDPDPNPSPSPTSPLPKFDTPINPRRGQTPASAIAAAHRQATSTGDDRSPSRSSRYSRKNSDEETPGSAGTQESPRVTPDGEKGLPPSLQRYPFIATGSVQSPENGNSSMRSRMRPPSTLARSKPPSMPLPPPPVPNAPSPEILSSPLRQTFEAQQEPTTAQKTTVRPRAHTIGSVGNSSVPTTLTRPTLTIKPTATSSPSFADIPEVNFDIETASLAQVREALKTRNQQYDELAIYVLNIRETHTAEVTNLEKKISSLDKEVTRKDKELKGLRWIINNGDSQSQPLPPGVLNHALLSPTSTLSESDQETSKVKLGVTRRVNYQSDSGTESVRSVGSGSESVSSAHNRSLRKPSTLAEVTYNFYRNASTRRSKLSPGLGAETAIPEMPTSINKRSSLNSVSPSPSSSTSSLLPPSPSITMSSLSAIPEGPPCTLRPLRYDNSEQEERRALRASHRISTSSMASSSTAASSAYSGNIKRSRPPSIAQVLEKSPIMDDVLEKLRPFA